LSCLVKSQSCALRHFRPQCRQTSAIRSSVGKMATTAGELEALQAEVDRVRGHTAVRTHLQKLAQLLARLAVLVSLLFTTVAGPATHASPPSPPEQPSPATQLPPGSLSPTPTRFSVLLPVILRNTDASSETECHSLTLSVSGGMGAPPAAGDPNCAGGLYSRGSVVTLIARPSPASRVYRWHGTDDDTSTSTINWVTITSDKRVSVHYIHEGDPSTPVGWGSEGGVATVQGAPHLESRP